MKALNCIVLLSRRMRHSTTGSEVQAIARKSLLLTITFAVLALVPLCQAQNQGTQIQDTPTQNTSLASSIEVVRAGSQADRVTIISQAMNFSDKDAATFWPIYRKYEYERSTIDDRRVAVIKDYAAKYPNLTDADAKAMADKMFDCEYRLAELKKKYFKTFNAALPALTVAKFFQIEHRVDLVMDMRVESSLPPLARPESLPEEPQPEQSLQQN